MVKASDFGSEVPGSTPGGSVCLGLESSAQTILLLRVRVVVTHESHKLVSWVQFPDPQPLYLPDVV